MRRLISVIILITIITAVSMTTACSQKKEEFNFTTFWDKVDEELIQQGKISSMNDLTQQEIDNLYNIKPDLIKNSMFRIATNPEIEASEIAVIETTGSAALTSVQQSVGTRQQSKYSQWENGIPDQFTIVKDYKTTTKGNYILYVVSPSADKIIEIFNSFF
ncbi:MAG: hypothetical protein K0S55_748 [Clostridia bacterium]|jgi:hypothetical protein|nr:hypothetical protein [Clostridia bacterium]